MQRVKVSNTDTDVLNEQAEYQGTIRGDYAIGFHALIDGHRLSNRVYPRPELAELAILDAQAVRSLFAQLTPQNR